jgi:hypothetical protein
LDLSNIKLNLSKDGLFTFKNIYSYAINNTLFYETNVFNNGIASIYASVPYNFRFVMTYIINSLGNFHIVANYCNFYYAAKDIIGHENMKYLVKVLDSYEDALELLEKKNSKIVFVNYDIVASDVYIGIGFNNRVSFEEYVSKNIQRVLHGFFIRDFSWVDKLLRLKDDYAYFIRPYVLFTFINNELKCYVWKDLSLYIYENKEEDYYINKEFYNLKSLVPPLIFSESFNTYSTKKLNLDNITNKIRKVCALVGKTYKKYINLAINQIHGFASIKISLGILDINGNIEPIIQNMEDTGYIIPTKNYEMSKWIYDLAISPALYPDFKCDNQELHYQPLDID